MSSTFHTWCYENVLNLVKGDTKQADEMVLKYLRPLKI